MSSNLFEFMLLVGKLKSTKRTGWLKSGVQNPESIADHMYRMGVLSMIVDPTSGINKEKCIKMSLVHDLAESIVGDITPHCGVNAEEKYCLEKDAMLYIQSLIGLETGKEMLDLWQEYEEQKTIESKFVKDLDKFDMIFQAYEYEKAQNMNLQDFFDSTKDQFETAQVKEWTRILYEMRKSPNNEFNNYLNKINDKKKSMMDIGDKKL